MSAIFGFAPSPLSAEMIAQEALSAPLASDERRLVITPNIDHIARLRRDPDFLAAYRQADVITCDGWPVRLYARLRGLKGRRVTGYDIASALLRAEEIPSWHRFFFVVDSEATAEGVHRWAARRLPEGAVATEIPPHGFLQNAAYCGALAGRIRAHGSTIVMMGVGAPRSEIFGARHRDALPHCWTFCLGQAVMVEAGTIRRAPTPLRHTGLEWAWRLAHEPRRLARRYVGASLGFMMAVADDLRGAPLAGERGAGQEVQ
jgi:N-acetylglucosaminyldiphosphoundecaprenol N-acetyl-beta-D-mannosaminyltransferase